MNTDNTQVWIIAAVIVLALGVAAWLIRREQHHRQSRRLRLRFGPEYQRVVSERGNRTQAEAELRAREQRVRRLKLVELTAGDKSHFSQAWATVQTRFVDNPQGAVVEADHLVQELMVRRGYPMADFEHRAADISVEYPTIVEAYRSARAIAVRDQQGHASTEELRQAIVYYRTLFDELLGVRHSKPAPAHLTETVHT